MAEGAARPENGSASLDTIFVSIPSYRDPECQYTVLDLFRKAAHPERVHIGICWQVDREEDAHCFLLDHSDYAERIRTVFLHHSQARGPCPARALVQQKLYRGEDFYLQLDSHYRMIEGWDEELLRQLRLCPGEKPILTTYPSSYTLPDDYAPGGPDRAKLHPNEHPVVICAREFAGADGFLRIAGKLCHAATFGGLPQPALFWAAGFAFSAGAVVNEVPYDATLEDLFFGEESSMMARLWTSGWDFFAPTRVIGYHLWTRKHRPIFREHACPEQKRREAESWARVRRQLAMPEATSAAECEELGLGSARTLSAFEDFCGVRFGRRHISDRALRGGLDGSAFVDGDPVAPAPAQPMPAAASAAIAAALGAPILGLLPSNAAQAIQGMAGSGPSSAKPTSDSPKPSPSAGTPPLLLKCDGIDASALTLLRLEDVQALTQVGMIVVNNFLRDRCYADCGRPAAEAAASIAHSGALRAPVRPARLGRGDRLWSSTAVRGDEMAWLSAPEGDGLRQRAEQRVRQSVSGEVASSAPPGQACGGAGSPSDCSEFAAMSQQLRAAFAPPAAAEPAAAEPAAGQAEGASASGGCRASDSNNPGAAGPCDEAAYEDLDVYLTKILQLRDELDSVLGFKSTRTSVMVARYPGGGARYARHRDALPEHEGSRRRLTAVYYLNPSWEPSDGGCLRAYFPEEVAKHVPGAQLLEDSGEWALDVEPRMDRLVLFASEWLEHEVLPAFADRYAVTTWLY